LRPYHIKNSQRVCDHCREKRRVVSFLSDEYIDRTFSENWTKQIFQRLGAFLGERGVSVKSQSRMLAKVVIILREAEQCFSGPRAMSQQWLETRIEQLMSAKQAAPTFFKAFLLKERIISDQEDSKRIGAMQAKIAGLPQDYQRVIEVYVNERVSERKRQIERNASKPLSLRTIESDLEVYTRTIHWLTEHLPELTGWVMVQEEHIHAFLLTLAPKQREMVRTDLHMLFRLARRRRLMTHVPVLSDPVRRWPQTVGALEPKEQKALARLIQESMYTHPIEAFLTALCFYHGLSSFQVLHIKTSDVDIERGVIRIQDRPPIYLLAEDLLLLEQFLQKRKEMPYAQQRRHLVISNLSRLDDEPLGKEYLKRKVCGFSGYTPQRLRISCFTILCEQYGPQYLVEAFGLSLTQAGRYGNLTEYLLEEEVKQQRKEFLEMSRQLEDREKQHRQPSPSEKAEVKHGDTI